MGAKKKNFKQNDMLTVNGCPSTVYRISDNTKCTIDDNGEIKGTCRVEVFHDFVQQDGDIEISAEDLHKYCSPTDRWQKEKIIETEVDAACKVQFEDEDGD